MSKFVTIAMLIVAVALLSACGQAAVPAAQAQIIKETVVVAGTPQVVEKVIEKEKVVVVTPTADPSAPKPLPAGSVVLNGAGATFPDPVYTEWRFAYQYVDPSVVINYQGIGSGGGKKGIADKTIDFAGSDSLLKKEEYEANPSLQMFPTLAGAVVPIFNAAPEVTELVVDGKIMADIYLGKITQWNDPAIAALNPTQDLPDKAITAVHRSDGSGTTEIFTTFLAAVSEDWKNGPGAGSAVEWPVDKAGSGIGGKGNPGVAAGVQNTPYSIGYVELSYAVANKIAFAKMVNAAGNTVEANAETLASAMADFGDKFDDKLMIKSISNGAGAKSWPIAGYTYMIVYKDMPSYKGADCVKAQKLLDFVQWALTDEGAAKRASDLGYATLPPTVRDKVFAVLATTTCDGAPLNFAK
ncbi:MAG: phosphate ABC transporter substrate-binding protein PstS [Thermoflexales bacterium]|nr:phosphate ABC transporter substrate-binding protein PstS [Thermoflexales bacterium]